MKETKLEELERNLRSWELRQPSLASKRRIFCGDSNPLTESIGDLGEWFTIRWLGPAMACLVVALMTVSAKQVPLRSYSSDADHWVLATITPSNGIFSAHLPMRFDLETSALTNSAQKQQTSTNIQANSNQFGSLISLVTNSFRK